MASPKHWAHVRWSRLAAGPALALLLAAAVAGCTTSSSSGTVTSATAAALTTAQARAIFDGYVAAAAKAARTNDSALALSVVTGVQQGTLAAALKDSATDANGSADVNGRPGYGQYAYGPPAFALPEPAGYPRFFVADVARTFKGTNPSDGMAARVAGAEVPVDGHVLMVFEQAAATTAWQLASTSQLTAGQPLPRLATDKDGYVPQVPLSTTALLARPDVTGPLQAALVDDGPASAAATAVAAGPLTTGLYQGAREHVEGLTAPRGDVYQWELEGTPFPAFALRTASGGALVLYAMYLNSTVAVPGVISKASAVPPGLPITVPPNFLPLLAKGKPAPRKSLETQQLLSFAALDPPASPAKVTVIAIGGGPNYATGY